MCSARVCQILRRRTHLRGAPSSHHRGGNSFKLVPPARGYGPPCCYEPLCSSPVVEPAGMTSSIPCRELEFGPSRHCGTSNTMATWPLRDRKTAQVAEWVEGGGERGGGGGDREWRRGGGGGGGGGFVPWGGWRRQGRGEGVNRRRRQASFLIKTDHSHQPYQNLVACLHKTTRIICWHGPILYQGHTYHETMTGYSQQNGKIKMGRGWERGEGGGNGKGHQWVTMLVMEHGPSHMTITIPRLKEVG